MTQEKPSELYKYMKPEIALIVLKNKTLRYSEPSEFNDYYDANPPYIFADTTITKEQSVFIRKVLNTLTEQSRILSLSSINNDIMMWGHYTDCNQGVVIGFNPKAERCKKATKVNYDDNIVKISGSYYELTNVLKNINPFLKALETLFTTKRLCWRYENEWRIVIDIRFNNSWILKARKNYPEYETAATQIEQKEKYVDLPFKPEDVKSLYLGAKISPENQKEIINLIKQNYQHIKEIYKVRYAEDEYKIYFNLIKI